jgi:hypothetical protein
MAAVSRAYRADGAWRRAEEALDDYDCSTESAEFQAEQFRRAMEPSDAQIDAALDRMDRFLGPGWMEEGERYWAEYYARAER